MTPMEARTDPFTSLLARAQDLKKGDDAAVKALLAEMLAVPLSDERSDMLVRAAARASRFALATVRSLVAAERLSREREARATPEAQEAARASQAAAEAAEKIVRDAEGERLRQSCQDLARAPNLMNRMEAVAHGLGVVGERTAICGTYLAMTSRLLRDNSISLLRRGAPAGGKNFLIACLSRLMPKDSIISISSASPMALIYHGEDEDALAHKIIVVAEVAAILQTNNGDEHPMAAMLRTLLSEGRIDREVAITQRDGVPRRPPTPKGRRLLRVNACECGPSCGLQPRLLGLEFELLLFDMARPKRADGVGNRLDQGLDRPFRNLFPQALGVGGNALDRCVANLLQALARRLKASLSRGQAARAAAFDKGGRQPCDDAVHLALGHAIGQLRSCDRGFVSVGLENLDAGRRLRLRLSEKGDDFRPAEARLRRAKGGRNNTHRRRYDKNNSFHGRAPRSSPPPRNIPLSITPNLGVWKRPRRPCTQGGQGLSPGPGA